VVYKLQIVEGDGPLARIAWKRVILDEAHGIKNYRSSTALSVCRLRANHRYCHSVSFFLLASLLFSHVKFLLKLSSFLFCSWALTGTPIQNDLSLRFLRCSPFDELKVWKKWVENKGGKTVSYILQTLFLVFDDNFIIFEKEHY